MPTCACGRATRGAVTCQPCGSAATQRARAAAELPRRLMDKVDQSAGPDGCWPWRGAMRACGYGKFRVTHEQSMNAHRAVYELLVGPVPDGLPLDHLCHTRDRSCVAAMQCPHRRCCNPAHLEPVTHQGNALRGRSPVALNATRTQCPKGHPYDAGNTARHTGSRSCKRCNAESHRRRRSAAASARWGSRPPAPTRSGRLAYPEAVGSS